MNVFKYLVALADISVGFLGLFFIIFAVTRPVTPDILKENQQLENRVQELQSHLQSLQDVSLSKTQSGEELERAAAAEISVFGNGELLLKMKSKRQRQRFQTDAQFQAFARKTTWPQQAILYIDQNVPFARVAGVIDALEQANDNMQVQIATLRN